MATSSPKLCRFTFLHLPGEIRNTIYRLVLVPSGKSVLIVNHPRPRPIGFTVLDLPLFRVSHQIRAEAASLLCSEKPFEIISIRAANVVFACLGHSLESISQLTLVRPTERNGPAGQEDLDKFLGFMERAEGLKYLRLEVGRVHPRNLSRAGGADDWVFLGKVREWVQKRRDIEFEWCAPMVETRPVLEDTHKRRILGLRTLFGIECEAETKSTLSMFW
ncbi:hypothetical protein P153DRAFT_353307 [Dothidotthia symphoricarpi CBS 119687]|uniref:Uncharacterized protein n=1 Tax=Dothidotthia symphoricarpi CBS 119687 TaxID=1392245 RepID=A0A6A6ARE3_9PLEO|nr:uncharacterized protein P153DRAFT_353307 [Dothidotthia symphoricarpi CBS 119687]KAF2134106.1 hypothetical protein P153DRAFT_353307 [Dothidotthia symphoricarpi CBS 119687]